MAANTGTASGQRRSLRLSRQRKAAADDDVVSDDIPAADARPPKRRKAAVAKQSHLRVFSQSWEATDEPCVPPTRPHTVEYHRPLLLSESIGAKGRAQLLSWFDSVSSARGMPWRKPWIDPGRHPDAQELRLALERRAYEVWISEIMLQQTRVAVVVGYWNRWMARWPTIQDLAGAEVEHVLAAWRGLGYYSRATRIHEAAKLVAGDADMRGLLPASAAELEARIPGVGRYTAGAISAIVYGRAEPMVDGNVLRVLSRQLGLHADVKTNRPAVDAIWAVAAALARAVASDGQPSDGPGRWGQALMELGSTVCMPKPDCSSCPITLTCRVYGEGGALVSGETTSADIEDACTLCSPMEQDIDVPGVRRGADTAAISEYARRFPAKIAKKKALREEETIVCAIKKADGAYLIQRRPQKGLLAGLWELPSVAVDPGTDPTRRGQLARTRAAGLVAGVELRHAGEMGSVPWAFSHLKLTMHVHGFVVVSEFVDEEEAEEEEEKEEEKEENGRDGSRWTARVEDESMGTGMRKCWALAHETFTRVGDETTPGRMRVRTEKVRVRHSGA
ncbi:A/G-specific adenine glycosylase [Ophiocordyceps camponoti-floridani]|uniref:Adenine DNA glycosylase n=1 Tax=Ophiocordyceps camponoti-floridani TaxID=2030778 RepID=A0A8H4Q0D7_9HYPO|nr:A/G-specific adenine glycosylase [Ophiocordyceps camponoti-floridani]